MSAWKPLKPKMIHRAHKVAPDGSVSPLCAKRPRAIDLRRASWTLVNELVTCRACRKILNPSDVTR